MGAIAVVGGGFSGTALVAKLLRSSQRPMEIVWLEKSGVFGAGLAYGTDDPNHVLNVPADRMSALGDNPAHFADWLAARREVERSAAARFFAPRRLYRAYLQDLVDDARRNPGHPASSLNQVAQEVVSLAEGSVETASGRRFQVDKTVLATGYLSESCFGSALANAFASDRWPESAVREIVLIGTGLTAIDAALSALERYPHSRVTAISRHGLLPQRFAFVPPAACDLPPSCSRKGLKWLRRQAADSGWDEVFAAMRPKWEEVWAGSSPSEQRQFLRHLRPCFDALRHRMPPSSADAIAQYQRLGRFQVVAGEVLSVEEKAVRYRSDDTEREQPADLVVDCSGPSPHWTSSGDPLPSFLISGRHALPGPHGMGIAVSPQHQVLGPRGPLPWLYALGPMLRGQRWETTAVAEIRGQVETVASWVCK